MSKTTKLSFVNEKLNWTLYTRTKQASMRGVQNEVARCPKWGSCRAVRAGRDDWNSSRGARELHQKAFCIIVSKMFTRYAQRLSKVSECGRRAVFKVGQFRRNWLMRRFWQNRPTLHSCIQRYSISSECVSRLSKMFTRYAQRLSKVSECGRLPVWLCWPHGRPGTSPKCFGCSAVRVGRHWS